YDEITPQMIAEIRREITAVINSFDRPLLFKNLNAGQRLRLMTKCFPKAKFIFITREPVYTAQAILKSKRVLGLNDNDFWSIMPPNVKELEIMGGYEQIVKQIYYLENQIVKDSALAANNCFYMIHLNDLSVPYISTLARSFGFSNRAKHAEFPIIHVNEKISINEHDFSSLKKQVDRLDWTFMNNCTKLHPVPTSGLSSQAKIL
ncbi:MAG: sulfotransferase, partial [Desulfamplus sp.]|nr:sulfotransferase [Desulfamplus sp.]